jgi:hypothetical protein
MPSAQGRGDGLPHRLGDQAVVTGLSGVLASKGTAWSCTIDGQTYQKVDSVKLNAALTIEWKTVPVK